MEAGNAHKALFSEEYDKIRNTPNEICIIILNDAKPINREVSNDFVPSSKSVELSLLL